MYRLFSLLLFVIPIYLQAQIEKNQGDIYLSNSDKVSGKISWYNNQPGDIILMDSNDVKKIYHPDDILQIFLDNGKRFIVKNYKDSEGTHRLIFQSIIESPKISLFCRQESGAFVMYVLKDDVLVRLENNQKIFEKNNTNYMKYDYQYFGILTSFMSDRPDLVARIQKLKLTEKDITEIILNYNKGELTYYQQSRTKYFGSPVKMLFIQYNNYCSWYRDQVTDHSIGVAVGFQYYFARNNRNSIKVSIEYQSYKLEDTDDVYLGLGLRYQYDMYKSRPVNIYAMIHLLDLKYRWSTPESNISESNYIVYPYISPGLGVDVKIFPDFMIYGEINRLFQIKCLPGNFSFGLKYDIGK